MRLGLIAAVMVGLMSGPTSTVAVDPTAVIERVAAATVHGTTHTDVDPGQLDGVDGPVELTCGYVSRWAVHEITQAGGQARPVHTLTLDPWDESNNGHSMVEAWVDGRWVLFDLDYGATFTVDGEPLNLVEWVERVPSGDYRIVWLEADPQEPDRERLREVYRRPAQWPLVEADGTPWFPDDGTADAVRVGEYNPGWYRPMDAARWHARFYG